MKELFDFYQTLDENNSYALYDYWDKLTDYISENKEEALNYLKAPCSGEEYVIMSSVIDDVIERTLDFRFIEAMKDLSKIYLEETALYNIEDFIESAETFFE